MPRTWDWSAIRDGRIVAIVAVAGSLSCNRALRASTARDAGSDATGGSSGADAASMTGGAPAAGGFDGHRLDAPGTGGKSADASLPDEGRIIPCPVLPEPFEGADWLRGSRRAAAYRGDGRNERAEQGLRVAYRAFLDAFRAGALRLRERAKEQRVGSQLRRNGSTPSSSPRYIAGDLTMR